MASLHQFESGGDLRRYNALLEMADLITLHLALPELFKALSERLHKVISFEIANFSLHDPARNVMRLHVWEGNDLQSPMEVPVEDSASGWVWNHQVPLVMPDLSKETRFSRESNALRDRGIRSYCMLPLTTAQTRFGGLGLGSLKDDAYDESDIRLLTRVAKMVALALENSYIRQAFDRETVGLKALVDLNTRFRANLTLPQILTIVSSCIDTVLGKDYISLALQEESMRELRVYESGGTEDKGGIVTQAENSVKDCAPYQAFQQRETKVFRLAELKEITTQGTVRLVGRGIQSLCCIPLLAGKGALGTLNIGSRRDDAFDQIDVEILTQIASQLAVALDNSRAYREIEELKDKLAKEKLYLEDEIRTELNFEEIVGDSPALKRVLSQAKTVAPSGATTLILGETGTGKELIARAIHRMSTRKDGSFIKLNCAAIPTGLLESELFGHERGAFTGAISQKVGRLELADKGTLFLDEIGDIPLELQPKLLRVLQDQEFERLGSNRTIRVNVRLIAATNRDLARRVANHEFRSDLYYRLNVFPIVLPPLRERGGDVIQLIRYFVQKLSRRMDKNIDTIPTETMKALQSWSWPGNVRELENFIERSVILSEGPILRVPLAELRVGESDGATEGTLREVERRHIIRMLKETRGVIAGVHGAAVKLGLKRTTLQSRIQKLRISRQDYL